KLRRGALAAPFDSHRVRRSLYQGGEQPGHSRIPVPALLPRQRARRSLAGGATSSFQVPQRQRVTAIDGGLEGNVVRVDLPATASIVRVVDRLVPPAILGGEDEDLVGLARDQPGCYKTAHVHSDRMA